MEKTVLILLIPAVFVIVGMFLYQIIDNIQLKRRTSFDFNDIEIVRLTGAKWQIQKICGLDYVESDTESEQMEVYAFRSRATSRYVWIKVPRYVIQLEDNTSFRKDTWYVVYTYHVSRAKELLSEMSAFDWEKYNPYQEPILIEEVVE